MATTTAHVKPYMYATRIGGVPKVAKSSRKVTVADGETIYDGTIVMLNAEGKAVAGRAEAGLVMLGHAEHGAGASETLLVSTGLHFWKNAGDIVRGDRSTGRRSFHEGLPCHVVDNDTVSLDGTGKARAGRIYDADALGVWVLV